MLFFYVLAVIAFVGSFANLMNHEAMKLVYGDSYVVMLAFGVLGALLILPFIIMASQKNPMMPRRKPETALFLWFPDPLAAPSVIPILRRD